jgi:hypothetical protein
VKEKETMRALKEDKSSKGLRKSDENSQDLTVADRRQRDRECNSLISENLKLLYKLCEVSFIYRSGVEHLFALFSARSSLEIYHL